jgi:hypothetical protein
MVSKLLKLALIAAVFVFAFSASAFAQWDDEDEDPFYFGFEAGFSSRAMWRGIIVSDAINFQPDFWAGFGPVEFNAWGIMDLQNINDRQWEFGRVDLSLTYDHSFDMFDVTAGGIYYLNPDNNDRNTIETFAGVKFPAIPLDPSLTVYWDLQEAEGVYYDLGVEGVIGGTDDITGMDWNAHLGYATGGYNNFYFGDATTDFGPALTDFRFEISRKFAFGGWYLRPVAGFSALVDNELRDKAADADNFWFGVFAGIEL